MTEGEPQLKYKVSRTVDCGDLDDFVNMHLEGYGLSWRALDTGSDGYHNGSYAEATVKVGAEIEDDLDQDFDRWLTGEGPFYLPEEERYTCWTPDIQHILQWLCNIGKIPAGKYVVHLWW